MTKGAYNNKSPIIYQAKNGAIELRGDLTHETVWATRMQMAQIFGVNPPAITKHIKNIYAEDELKMASTSSKMELVQDESGRSVRRKVDIYNLDLLIAVGYRINSIVGTRFRQWATKTLRSYIVDGFVVNKKLIAKNYTQFKNVIDDMKSLLPSGSPVNPTDAVELASAFADTWLSLDAYDRGLSLKGNLTKKKVDLTAEIISDNLTKFKQELVRKSEAT